MNPVFIQAVWRSVRCRKKVLLFSKLPTDLWHLIISFIRTRDKIFARIDRIIHLRSTRFYWTAPHQFIKSKMHTLQLIRKYSHLLHEETIQSCLVFALRMLKYIHTNITHELLINATVEVLIQKFEKDCPKK